MALINRNDVYYIDCNADGSDLRMHNWGESAICNMRDWSREHSYLIEFKRADVFKYFMVETIIPEDTMAAIRDRNSDTYLVMSNSHEGFGSAVDHVYIYVCAQQKIPVEKVIMISGGFDIEKHVNKYAQQYDKPPLKCEWLVSFEGSYRNRAQYFLGWEANEAWTKHGVGHAKQMGDEDHLLSQTWPITNHATPYNKLYVCFNRRWRPHRPSLVGLLSERGLLDRGYVSLGVGDDPRTWRSEWQHLQDFMSEYEPAHEAFVSHKEQLLAMPNLYLDTEDLVTNRAEFELDTAEYYENSLFSLVNETNYFVGHHAYEDMIFLSEKFFKPVLMRHPFLIVSTPGIYRAIHALGYKTFPEFIPEDFDNVHNDAERMWRIVDIVEEMSTWDRVKQQEFVDYATPICEHNWQTLWHKRTFCHRMNY